MSEIAVYSQHDSEINLPVVSRNVPRHPEWAYLGTSGGGVWCWVVLWTHGIYLSSLTDYVCHARSHHNFHQLVT